MAHSAYTDVADSRIDAYSPITARLVVDLVENQEAVGLWVLQPYGHNFQLLTGWSVNTWTTLGTMRLFVPDCAIGATSCRLTVGSVTRARLDVNDDSTPQVRLKYSSTEGTAVSVGVGVHPTYTYDTATMTLDFVPTDNTVVDILWQGQFSGGSIGTPGSSGLGFLWPRTDATDTYSYGQMERIE